MDRNGVMSPSDRLYNSRIAASYVKFLRKKYSHVDVDDLLSYAGMEIYQVEDEGYWFAQEQVDRFNERLIQLTGNPDISREAGRFGFSSELIGFVKNYVLGCMSIGNAFEMITQLTSKFAKSCTWTSTRLGTSKVKVVVTPKPGTHEKPYQCQNRMGYFEGACVLFRHKFPQVEHAECTFRGDESCEYIITWQEFTYEIWKKIRTYAGICLLGIATAMLILHIPSALASMATVLAALLTASAYLWRLEKGELRSGIDNLSQSMDQVAKKMETSIKNMDFARQVIVALSQENSREGMMKQITSLFEKELDYDRGTIFLPTKRNRGSFFSTVSVTRKSICRSSGR